MAAPADPKSVPDDERPPPLAVKKTEFRVRHRVRISATHHSCRRGGAGARRCDEHRRTDRSVRGCALAACMQTRRGSHYRVPTPVRMTIASVALYRIIVLQSAESHDHVIEFITIFRSCTVHDHAPDTCMKILYILWTLRLQCADGRLLQSSQIRPARSLVACPHCSYSPSLMCQSHSRSGAGRGAVPTVRADRLLKTKTNCA